MNTENRLAVFYITNKGLELAGKISLRYPLTVVLKFDKELVAEQWKKKTGLIFIMAAGIAVRTIAPLIRDKKTDPPVIVIDELGRHAISLLSGHLGGANLLTESIAEAVGAEPVITTASDVNGLPAIDLWAREEGLVVENPDLLPKVGARMINNGILNVYSEVILRLPEVFQKVPTPEEADIIITNKKTVGVKNNSLSGILYLRPRNLIIGVGCNSGTTATEIGETVKRVINEHNLSFASVCLIATIDLKGKEKGLVEFADRHGLKIALFSPEELNSVEGITMSEAAFRSTGARAVAEPAALLASRSSTLLLPKHKQGNVTVAAAEIKAEFGDLTQKVRTSSPKNRTSKLYIVGTGPGSADHITPYAQKAIQKSDVIVGYGTYLSLIPELLRGKEIVSTGMTQEIDRCRKALQLVAEGQCVSVISGGDPGIYAMAGLVFELARRHKSFSAVLPSIEVIPGISALNACASRLGAPLMHDFASVSLSDRLTPWDVIEKRLEAAAAADFVIALYNPRSKGRAEHLGKARLILLKHRSPSTPVGIVKGAMRPDERIVLTDLQNMSDCEVDMQTTVIIGNSATFVLDGWMVTPRGYERKNKFDHAGGR